MKLRQYQDDCVAAILEKFEEYKSTLFVLPTGAGKTQVFSSVIKQFIHSGRVMVLAHRKELIEQAAKRIEQICGVKPDIEMGEQWADDHALMGKSKVVVSSIQTQISGARGAGRMTRFAPSDFSLLVVDESHHGTAKSYTKVIDYYRQNPELKLLGCTATPDRADEEALGKVFESVAYEYELRQAILDGWLVPIRQRMVYVDTLDFSAMRTTAGDLNGADLAATMEFEENLHKIAHPAFELSGKRKTLIFAVTVKQAERIAEILNRHEEGCAQFVCGETPPEDRARLFRDYAEGRYRFLVNVGIATEGWDEPTVECIVMARPTKSRSLYAQMIGRGTRPLAGILDEIPDAQDRRVTIDMSLKPFCEVIDFTGNSGNHKLVHSGDILGGNYSDEEVEEAEKIIKASSVPLDTMEVLEQAKKNMEIEKARREEAARRSHIKGKATYNTKSFDPFDVLQIEHARSRGWDTGKTLSEKQRGLIERQGIDPATLSYADGCKLVGELCRRFKQKLCTFKMSKLLQKHGYPGDMPMDQAKRTIDALAANGWKRPAEPVAVGEQAPW